MKLNDTGHLNCSHPNWKQNKLLIQKYTITRQQRQDAPNLDNDMIYYLLLLMTVAGRYFLTGHTPHVRIQVMTA